MKLLYEEDKWIKIASALENVNEAHKYDNKYEDADKIFEDSKSEIAEKDVDGAITFKPLIYQPEAKPIRKNYKKLYDYAKGIGKIIDEKVDTPFYKAIDEYIQKMADLNVTSYQTANTINVQEGSLFSGAKDKITLNDLYDADTTYSAKLKTEFETWKIQNPSETASEEDYRTAALNSGAFEYEGIRAGQEKKELWFNLIATGVVVSLAIVCPPAGLAAGAIYTAIDVGGAIKGEDLISGRKLSDEERMMRGAFVIVPGAGGLAAKSLLKHMPALKTVMKTVSKPVNDAVKPIKSSVDPIILKGKQSIASRIKTTKHHDVLEITTKSKFASKLEQAKELGKAHADQLKFAVAHPILSTVISKAGQKTIRGTAKFIDNALRPFEVRTVQTTTGNKVFAGIERGESSGKLTEKADNYIAIKQAEKDSIRGTGIVNEVKEIDFGMHIIKGENGKKQLLPNTKYVTNDNYKYTTDEFGRIVNVNAPELVLKKANRNKYAQANVGGKDRLPDDDGGHLIGAQFNGPPDIDNLVPQNNQINRRGGVWYEMETEWANALKEVPPKKVSVSIEPIYSNNSMRPDSFMVEYEIEGQFPVIRDIANKLGG